MLRQRAKKVDKLLPPSNVQFVSTSLFEYSFVRAYYTTSPGNASKLPDNLLQGLRDQAGVLFFSAFYWSLVPMLTSIGYDLRQPLFLCPLCQA